MITATGFGLNVIVNVGQHDPWMLFACWYSLHRYLPEAVLSYVVNKDCDPLIYGWTHRAKIKRLAHLPDEPCLLVPHNTIACQEITLQTLDALNATSGGIIGPLAYFRNLDSKSRSPIHIPGLLAHAPGDDDGVFIVYELTDQPSHNENKVLALREQMALAHATLTRL